MTHKGTITLETERLILRRFELSDAEAMFRNWANDAEVTRFLMWQTHTDVSVTERVLNEWIPQYEKPDYYHWAIVLREIGEPIGSIAAVRQSDDDRMVHIGYCIGKEWWHKGIMSEALNAMVKFYFEEVGVNRVESRHDPRNPNSGKVMQKAGLRYEGTSRQSDHNNQGVCDTANYAILAEDYFAVVAPEHWDVYTAERVAKGYSRTRSESFAEDEYHLGAAAWIVSNGGRVLLARRAINRSWNPGKWEIPGGHVVAGEDSLTAAIREVREELGLTLSGDGAKLIGTFTMLPDRMLCDVFIIRAEVALSELRFNKSETIDAKFATLPELRGMLARSEFIAYPGIDKELAALERELAPPIVRIIPYSAEYRDDMLFCFMLAKDALSRAPNSEKPYIKPELLNVEGVYLKRGDIFLLAIDADDRVVGMVGTETVSPTDMWLKRLFIKPDVKGKGVGSKLLAEVEKFAVSEGINTLHTRFADWYAEATRFYPAKGFVDSEPSKGLRHMVKRLEKTL
jgi:ribosomal-protein-alanine N-acetyltransferase